MTIPAPVDRKVQDIFELPPSPPPCSVTFNLQQKIPSEMDFKSFSTALYTAYTVYTV